MAQSGRYDVREYGAIGDGETVVTAAIQAAIDGCSSGGGGTVVIAGGSYVSGTLFFRNNVMIEIAAGAEIRGSHRLQDYAENCDRCAFYFGRDLDRCLLFADGVKNIGLCGTGRINGGIAAGIFPFPNDPDRNRPMLLRFMNSSGIRVRDVTFMDSLGWVTNWKYCDDIVIDGITIDTGSHGANGDGIDLDGCQDVRISNCYFDCNDDCIAMHTSRADRPCRRVVISNCVMRSCCAGMRIGLVSRGDFEDICVSNCVISDGCVRHPHNRTCLEGIKIQMSEGGAMRNMVFSGLTMRNVMRPLLVQLVRIEQCDEEKIKVVPPIGIISGLTFESIFSETRDTFCFRPHEPDDVLYHRASCHLAFSGIPGGCLENITLSNIHVTTPGGGTEADAVLDGVREMVPEKLGDLNQAEYFFFERTLPVHGLYARHVRNLTCRNVTFDTATPDARRAVVLDDVTLTDDKSWREFSVNKAIP